MIDKPTIWTALSLNTTKAPLGAFVTLHNVYQDTVAAVDLNKNDRF